MKKYLLILLFIPLFVYGQYSVIVDSEKAKDYSLNGNAVSLPIYVRVADSSNMDVSRKGRKSFRVDIARDNRGWLINKNYSVALGKVAGIGLDFATGKIYVLPSDLMERISKTLTPEDSLILDNSINNENSLGVLLVDVGALRRERIDRFALLSNEADRSKETMLFYTPVKDFAESDSIKGIVVDNRPIITAAANGQIDLTKKLLQNGENINETDPADGDNALMKAIKAGNTSISGYLIDNGIDLLYRNRYGQNALHLSSGKGYYDLSKDLISAGIDLNQKDNNGNTPLMYAAVAPNANLVELLVNLGANKDAKNNEGMSALSLSAYNGNTKNAEILLDKGADINSTDRNGNSVLIQAILGGNEAVAEKLIARDSSDINKENNNGDSPLHIAVLSGNPELTELLLSSGADVNKKNAQGQTPLMIAAELKSVPIMSEILKYSPDMFAVNNAGESVYDIAIRQGDDVKKSLVQAIVSEDEKVVALFDSVANGDYEKTDYYLKQGVRPNITDVNSGNTPLIIAIANNYKEIAELLMKYGADVNWQNNRGNTPLIVSVSTGDESTVNMLLAGGADPNLQNVNGDTPLIWSAKLKRTGVVRSLLIAGANPNIRNNDGITALSIASNDSSKEIEKLLKSFGAF